MTTQTAVVLGASGSVGNALIRELIRSGAFNPIIAIGRRSQPAQLEIARGAGIELRESLVPEMTPENLEAATAESLSTVPRQLVTTPVVPRRGFPRVIEPRRTRGGRRSATGGSATTDNDAIGDGSAARVVTNLRGAVLSSSPGTAVGLSVLGIGAGTAKLPIDDHRAVDVQLNAAFARALASSGKVKHLALMSAVGANPTAATTGSGAAGMARYARVKGEAEDAVKASGLAVVSTFRPAMIIGSQHTPWLLEKFLPVFSWLTPAKYRSITTEAIAKAMVATSLHCPEQSAVYHYGEMMALGRSLEASDRVRGNPR